jgi:hypothetical protein
MPKKTLKYYLPVNFQGVLIYLTPEQREKVKRLADRETHQMLEAGKVEGHLIVKPGAARVSVSDFIRAMVERDKE